MRGYNPSRVIKAAVFFAVLGGAVCADQASPPTGQQPTEYQIKAAYLLNFTKFIEWPPTAYGDAETPFTICIAGHDPFGAVIDQVVDGEAVNGRKIVVRRLETQSATSCHMIYGGKAVPGPSQSGVLTVGEGETFVKNGGIIGFVVENRRVRFDINQRVAQRAGILLSSKLLSVARAVEK